MLDSHRIAEIATDVALKNISQIKLKDVLARSATDSLGKEALRVTMVLGEGTTSTITGDDALNFLVDFQRRLELEGDDRFPIVEYATEAELDLSGDQEGDERESS